MFCKRLLVAVIIFVLCLIIPCFSSQSMIRITASVANRMKLFEFNSSNQELHFIVPKKKDKTGDWFKNFLTTELSGTYDSIPIQMRGNMPIRYTEESDLDVISGNIYTEIHYLMWEDIINLIENGSAQIYRYDNSYEPIIRNQTEYSDLNEYLNDLLGYIGEKALAGSHVRLWITEDEFVDYKNRLVSDFLVLRVRQQPYQLIPIFREAMDDKGRELMAKYLAYDFACFKESYSQKTILKGQRMETSFIDYLDLKEHYPLGKDVNDSTGIEIKESRGGIFIKSLEKTGMFPYLQKEGVTIR